MKTVITIAGFDPSGWAGVAADLRVFEDFGCLGVSAVTALTVQTRTRVREVSPVPSRFLSRELETLFEEFRVSAVKIGMLGSGENAAVAARLLKREKLRNIVLDPVLRSKRGFPLIDGRDALKKLFPLVTLVTPNTDEAGEFSGIVVRRMEDMRDAAIRISALGAAHVLVKGGHLEGPPVDVLYSARTGEFFFFEGERLEGRKEAFHGTGCVLSSAIAAGLARGAPVADAVAEAKKFLEEVLKTRLKVLGE